MGLVAEAQRLTPEIEAAAEEVERLRRLPDTSWTGMHEAGLFRALQPARWGGGEVKLREFVDAVMQVGRASGRWSFSSGSVHCSAVNLGVIAVLGDLGGGFEVPDLRSMLLLAGDYTIDDNWHVAGMKGTGSKDIIVDNAFVPEHRSQSHLDYFMDQPLPGWELNPGPLYRLPWSVVFNFALAASIYGTALGFIDRWVEEAKTVRRAGVR